MQSLSVLEHDWHNYTHNVCTYMEMYQYLMNTVSVYISFQYLMLIVDAFYQRRLFIHSMNVLK